MALGVLREARRRGLRVPEDLAVVGFNDIASASETFPPLTTVHLCLRQIGQMAAELLLKQVKTGQEERVSVLVRGELVVRESTVSSPTDPS